MTTKFKNLDKLYQDFVTQAVKRNPLRYSDAEKLEDDLGKFEEAFLNTSLSALDGLTPLGYIEALKKNGELYDYCDFCLKTGFDVADIVCDAVVQAEDAVDYLSGLLYDENRDASRFGATLLAVRGGEDVEDIFIGLLTNPEVSDEIKTAAYAHLSECDGRVADKILEVINTVPEAQQGILVEVLACFKGRKDVFYWLVTMLQRADDVAVYAGLLGAYGDACAIDILKSFVIENPEINYVEFVEIRNAVERLGGDLEDDKDYSDDPYFRYIHGVRDSDDKLQ